MWLMGLGVGGWVLWTALGTRTLQADEAEFRWRLRLLWLENTQQVPRRNVQKARVQELHYDRTNTTVRIPGAEVVYRGGSWVIPSNGMFETKWLVQEINDFLQQSSQQKPGKGDAPRQ